MGDFYDDLHVITMYTSICQSILPLNISNEHFILRQFSSISTILLAYHAPVSYMCVRSLLYNTNAPTLNPDIKTILE